MPDSTSIEPEGRRVQRYALGPSGTLLHRADGPLMQFEEHAEIVAALSKEDHSGGGRGDGPPEQGGGSDAPQPEDEWPAEPARLAAFEALRKERIWGEVDEHQEEYVWQVVDICAREFAAAPTQPQSLSREADRKRAITDAEAMRQTHVEWLEHLKPGIVKGEPHCVACAEDNVAAAIGDAAHHKDCIEKYDNLLAVLRG